MQNAKTSEGPAHHLSPAIGTPVHLQTINQLVLWQQLNAFLHANVVKTTSNQASE